MRSMCDHMCHDYPISHLKKLRLREASLFQVHVRLLTQGSRGTKTLAPHCYPLVFLKSHKLKSALAPVVLEGVLQGVGWAALGPIIILLNSTESNLAWWEIVIFMPGLLVFHWARISRIPDSQPMCGSLPWVCFFSGGNLGQPCRMLRPRNWVALHVHLANVTSLPGEQEGNAM